MRNAFISVHGYEAALHIHHMYLLSLCMGVCGKPLSLSHPLFGLSSPAWSGFGREGGEPLTKRERKTRALPEHRCMRVSLREVNVPSRACCS